MATARSVVAEVLVALPAFLTAGLAFDFAVPVDLAAAARGELAAAFDFGLAVAAAGARLAGALARGRLALTFLGISGRVLA
ncbi:MAG: hypothetical protein R3B13_28585 [Polyangiaceae bacterium]